MRIWKSSLWFAVIMLVIFLILDWVAVHVHYDSAVVPVVLFVIPAQIVLGLTFPSLAKHAIVVGIVNAIVYGLAFAALRALWLKFAKKVDK